VTAFIDYHIHTHHSFDCKIPMAEMCVAAIEAGISEIAFSDHFNNHLLDIDLGYYDPERYFTDVERCRRQFPNLTIRAAVELGEPHRWPSMFRAQLCSRTRPTSRPISIFASC
jgi:histidinol-phosphatase (PHP family)